MFIGSSYETSSNIFIGAKDLDYSGYPDCREIFLESYEKMINLGSKTGAEGGKLNILRPLINMRKIDIIKLGHSLKLDYFEQCHATKLLMMVRHAAYVSPVYL